MPISQRFKLNYLVNERNQIPSDIDTLSTSIIHVNEFHSIDNL